MGYKPHHDIGVTFIGLAMARNKTKVFTTISLAVAQHNTKVFTTILRPSAKISRIVPSLAPSTNITQPAESRAKRLVKVVEHGTIG